MPPLSWCTIVQRQGKEAGGDPQLLSVGLYLALGGQEFRFLLGDTHPQLSPICLMPPMLPETPNITGGQVCHFICFQLIINSQSIARDGLTHFRARSYLFTQILCILLVKSTSSRGLSANPVPECGKHRKIAPAL